MFGAPLEEHLRVTGQTVALPVQLCVCALLELGLSEEGLFRMAGSMFPYHYFYFTNMDYDIIILVFYIN